MLSNNKRIGVSN